MKYTYLYILNNKSGTCNFKNFFNLRKKKVYVKHT